MLRNFVWNWSNVMEMGKCHIEHLIRAEMFYLSFLNHQPTGHHPHIQFSAMNMTPT